MTTTNKRFMAWAKAATHGVDTSRMMLGVLNGKKADEQRLQFALQIGHCLLEDKPLYFVAPIGSAVPEKLKLAASGIEYYDPNNEESFKRALRLIMEQEGRPVVQ